MEKAILQLETLSCPSCMQKIEGAVKSVNGIDKDSIKVFPGLLFLLQSDSRCLETIKENFLNLMSVN